MSALKPYIVHVNIKPDRNKCLISESLEAIKIDLKSDIKPAVKVNDVIGKALPQIGPYKKLDNTKQVVALIDDVSSLLNLKFYIVNYTETLQISGLVHQLWKMLHDLR